MLFTDIMAAKPAFLFALPAAFLVLLILVVNVQWIIISVLLTRAILDPFLNMTKAGEGMGVGGLLNIFMVLLVMVWAFFRSAEIRRNAGLFAGWFIFLAVFAASSVFSPIPVRAMRLMLNLTSYLAMFTLPFIIIKSNKDKAFWIKLLIWASVLPALFGVFGQATHHDTYMMTTEIGLRLRSTFTHPNIFAFYLVFIFTVIFYALKSPLITFKTSTRRILVVYMLGLAALLVMTKTRSAWISCWVFFFLYGLLKERKYIFWALVLPAAALAIPTVWDRFSDLFTGSGSSHKVNSMQWRVMLWSASMESIKRHIWFGRGLASFNFSSGEFFHMVKATDAHNIYLEMLFETGIVGLLSYLALFAGIFRGIVRRIRQTRSGFTKDWAIIVSYLAGYLLVGYSDNMLYYLAFNWYFWFFMGLVLKPLPAEEPSAG